MKVGSMLVKEKIITEAQLEEALRNQVIFGGKIGTNLIELGYISAEKLSDALARHKGVPQAAPAEIHSIAPEIIHLIPAETAKKFQVLPVRLEKKRLTVAMADPADLAVIDKLSFMTGMYINPVVIPELLLIMALERYYKIKRETRYIAISKDMHRAPRNDEPPELNDRPAPAQAVEQKKVEEEEEFIEIPEFDGFDKVHIPEEPVKEKPPATQEELEDSYNLTDMCSGLAGATSREAIGEALMEYLRRRHFRVALFLPKEPLLNGWLAAEEKGYIEDFSDFKVEMAVPSAFLQVIETRNFYMGQLHHATDFKTASAINAQDKPAILLPIILMNRVVAILCVVDTLEKLTRSLNDFQKISVKSAMAFEILIMRNKIQML